MVEAEDAAPRPFRQVVHQRLGNVGEQDLDVGLAPAELLDGDPDAPGHRRDAGGDELVVGVRQPQRDRTDPRRRRADHQPGLGVARGVQVHERDHDAAHHVLLRRAPAGHGDRRIDLCGRRLGRGVRPEQDDRECRDQKAQTHARHTLRPSTPLTALAHARKSAVHASEVGDRL